MEVSYKLVKKLLNINLDVEEFAKKITAAGFEVEAINHQKVSDLLVIARVLSTTKHPSADKLNICEVEYNNQVFQVVCGAKNVRAGLKVILAQVGTKLPQLEIKESIIRDVKSEGMLCSLTEIFEEIPSRLLSINNSDGIVEVPKEINTDISFNEAFDLDDSIIELSITPNRSETVALHYLLKEFAAILDVNYSIDFLDDFNLPSFTLDYDLVQIDKCDYFSLTKLDDVHVKNNQFEDILHLASEKLISPLVNLSNYINLVFGQPNHFYDADKIKGKIRVVDNYQGEFLALDDQIYQIVNGDIVIIDDEKVLAIAGVIGSKASSVTENTKNIIIEFAKFSRMAIRNTARRLNITSKSSINFQKNIDLNSVVYGLKLALSNLDYQLIANTKYDNLNYQIRKIEFKLSDLNNYLGSSFTNQQILSVFKRLDFPHQLIDEILQVQIPSYRSDIVIKEDLYEEVIRILGYEFLPSTRAMVFTKQLFDDSLWKIERFTMDYLSHLGFNQTITYSLVSDKFTSYSDLNFISLDSPLSNERKNLRNSIIPSLVEIAIYNHARSIKDIALFEISDICTEEKNYKKLALIANNSFIENRYQHKNIVNDFYLVKSLVYNLLAHFSIDSKRINLVENKDSKLFHPNMSAKLFIGKEYLGTIGHLHPKYLKENNLNDFVAMEIDLELIDQVKKTKIKYKEVSKFPTVSRDLSLVMENDVDYSVVKKIVEKKANKLLESLELNDVYQMEDKKSITIRINLRSETQTLESSYVNELIQEIINELAKNYGIYLRG